MKKRWEFANGRIKIAKGQPCLHKECPRCGGTGRDKITGEICIHMISCPCPKCSPRM